MERSKINSNLAPKATPTPNNHKPSTPALTQHIYQPFISRLQADYPNFVIKTGPRFKFRPPRTIILNPHEPYFDPQTNQNGPIPLQYFALLSLHELGHALCKHKDYKVSIERIKIESEAWQMAKTVLAEHPEYTKKFGIVYDEDFAEAQLDTYRDWLHAKSCCPTCGLTRYQTPNTGLWHCPLCDQ